MYRDSNPVVTFLLCIVLIMAIIFGAFVINDRVSVKCFDWWPLKDKTCLISTR